MNNEIFEGLISLKELSKEEDGKYILPFSINKSSSVFEGHFPEKPILPGVVMIEITKRAMALATNTKLKLKEAGNFKFLRMIDPDGVPNAELHFSITQVADVWKVKAHISFQNDIYFKANAQYELG